MLTVNPEHASELFQFYKTAIRPRSANDAIEGIETTNASTTTMRRNSRIESAINVSDTDDSMTFQDRFRPDRESDRAFQLEKFF
jgi:hypothetical protein